MRVIEAYPLILGSSKVSMPDLANIIDVTSKGEEIKVLVEIDKEIVEKCSRAFLLIKVGEEILEDAVLDYIGCVYILSVEEPILVFEIL